MIGDRRARRGRRWWWALRRGGCSESSHFQILVRRSGIAAACYSIKGFLPKIPLPSFHKIKGSLTPKKEGGHNLEDRAHLYIEQILFYEKLATQSFAATSHPKPVKTLLWTSGGDHRVAEIPGSGLQVGRGQEEAAPDPIAAGHFYSQR